MRKIYHHGGFQIQASGSYPIWQCLAFYASVGNIHTRGKSLEGENTTSIWQLSFDMGLKALFQLGEQGCYYVGFGPRYFYVHQHNSSAYVDKDLHSDGIGLFANVGYDYLLADRLFIGVVGEYAYQKTKFVSQLPNVYGPDHTQVGGFSIGGSLGYAF